MNRVLSVFAAMSMMGAGEASKKGAKSYKKVEMRRQSGAVNIQLLFPAAFPQLDFD